MSPLAFGRTIFFTLLTAFSWAFVARRLGVPMWAAVASVVGFAFAVGYVLDELRADG